MRLLVAHRVRTVLKNATSNNFLVDLVKGGTEERPVAMLECNSEGKVRHGQSCSRICLEDLILYKICYYLLINFVYRWKIREQKEKEKKRKGETILRKIDFNDLYLVTNPKKKRVLITVCYLVNFICDCYLLFKMCFYIEGRTYNFFLYLSNLKKRLYTLCGILLVLCSKN
uniref:Transmembrane protein n=1 Tax=Heterorhabditis bacteriophora TaxID=37862 RepID=A0A1I7WLK6_HETBA